MMNLLEGTYNAMVRKHLFKQCFPFQRKRKRYKPPNCKMWRLICIKKRRRIGLKIKHAEPKKEVNYSQKGSKVNSPILFYILLGCSIIHNTRAVHPGMQLAPLMQNVAVTSGSHAITYLIFPLFTLAAPIRHKRQLPIEHRGKGILISEINSHDLQDTHVSHFVKYWLLLFLLQLTAYIFFRIRNLLSYKVSPRWGLDFL